MEFYLSFVHCVLLRHRASIRAQLPTFLPLLRRLGRVLGRLRGEVGRVAEDGLYVLEALRDTQQTGDAGQAESEEGEEQRLTAKRRKEERLSS